MERKTASQMVKVAEGREAEMFAWGDGKILRLMRSADGRERLEREMRVLEAARSQGLRVPAVYELTEVEGRPGMVMERIDGPDLLTLIGRRPVAVFRVGRISGEVHARMHEVRAPDVMPGLKETLRSRIQAAGALLGRLERFALETLDGLPDGESLCHGDFHPANILMAGETPVVIDWANARRGDAAADVARTRLMLRLGEPPPGTSLGLRTMALVGRRLLVGLYLRSYRRHRPLDMEVVRRWEVPVAAARLTEGIESETPKLLAFLGKAARSQGRGSPGSMGPAQEQG